MFRMFSSTLPNVFQDRASKRGPEEPAKVTVRDSDLSAKLLDGDVPS